MLFISACGTSSTALDQPTSETPPPIATNSAPSLSINSPSQVTKNDTESVTFNGTAQDQEDGDISANIVWSSNIDGEIGQGHAVSVVLSSGEHTITASITDSASQTTSASIGVTVTVTSTEDNAPTITITTPSTGQTSALGNVITFTATASDDEDGDISSNIGWSSNVDGEIGQGNSISMALSEGVHTITASITDSASQTNTATISVTVTGTPVDNNAPTITITSPTTGQNNPPGHAITFTATSADEEDGDISANIQWSSSIDGSIGSGSSISFELSAGSHTITASISDSDDQTASDSIEMNIISDNIPTLNITAPTNNSSQIENNETTLIANASDNEDGNISANISWFSSIDGDLGTGAQIATTLSLGEHAITATIVDSDNNSVSSSVTHTVVVTFGSASLSWVAPTENTDGSELTDLAGFTIYYGTSEQQLNNTITIDSAETLNFIIENLSSNTTYFFSITAFNSTGVESAYTDVASKYIQG